MEIVTVMHDFRGGGAEKAAIMLADNFLNKGILSEILCVALDGPMLIEKSPALPITCIGARKAYHALPSIVRLMRRRLDTFFLSHLTHMNVVVALAALISGHQRTFVVEHNDFKMTAADLRSPFVKGAYYAVPHLYSRVAGVFCVSESVRDSLGALSGAKGLCSVVVNPISSSRLEGQAVSDVGSEHFSDDAQVLVACGRLTAQKNYPMMLRAVRQIAQQRNIKLVILGDGPDKHVLQAMAVKLGIDELVVFYGFATNPHSFFGKARLLLSTSDWEGLPMTMIEALYCGADFVSTRSCSSVAELSQSGSFGTCVDRQDLDGFVAAVLDRLERPVAPLSEKRRFLAKYEVERVASDYVDAMCSGTDGPVRPVPG